MVLVRREVKESVPNNGPADRTAHAVVIETGSLEDSAPLVRLVQRVEPSIHEVLVERSVQFVRTALDDGVELAARRAPEFGSVLVLQRRELGHGLVRNLHDASGDVLGVVVYALDHEAVIARTLAAYRRPLPQAGATAGSDTGALKRQVQYAEREIRAGTV